MREVHTCAWPGCIQRLLTRLVHDLDNRTLQAMHDTARGPYVDQKHDLRADAHSDRPLQAKALLRVCTFRVGATRRMLGFDQHQRLPALRQHLQVVLSRRSILRTKPLAVAKRFPLLCSEALRRLNALPVLIPFSSRLAKTQALQQKPSVLLDLGRDPLHTLVYLQLHNIVEMRHVRVVSSQPPRIRPARSSTADHAVRAAPAAALAAPAAALAATSRARSRRRQDRPAVQHTTANALELAIIADKYQKDVAQRIILVLRIELLQAGQQLTKKLAGKLGALINNQDQQALVLLLESLLGCTPFLQPGLEGCRCHLDLELRM